MLVIAKKSIGRRGGNANGKQTSRGKGLLTARQEAFARGITIHGMSGLMAYRLAYANKMSDKAATNEASKLKGHPLVMQRVRELKAMLVEVDLHDRAETDRFVLDGLKRLALNGENGSTQLGAYRLIGNLSHARMFDAPVVGVTPDNRSADAIRKALQQRVSRLLPAPASANDQSAPAASSDANQVVEAGIEERVEDAGAMPDFG